MLNEKTNLDGLLGIFTDYEKQIKKKVRRTIALIVIVCLLFGLLGFLCGRASAYYSGSDTDCDTVLYSIGNSGRSDILQGYFSEATLGNSYTYILMSRVYVNSSLISVCYAVSDYPFVYINDCFYSSNPGAHLLWCDGGTNFNTLSNKSETSISSPNGDGYFRFTNNNYFNYGYYLGGTAELWSDFEFSVNGSVACSFNLDASVYLPDQRSLSASKVYLTDNYYLQIEAYPTSSFDFGYVTLTYFDTLGTFTKTLSKSDGIRVSESGEDAVNSYVTLTINPNLVSQYKFTVTSVEYVSSGDFGSKSVSELDLIFNEDPFPLPTGWDSIISYSTYNSYSSIGTVGGGIATFEIGYLNNNQSLLSWRESTGKVHQPFRLSWIVIPDFLWDYGAFQFADFNLEEMFQLFESYDVVILGVGPSIFNDLYPDHVDPAGLKDNYDYVKSAWQLGLGVDYCISVIDGFESPYRSCNRSDSDYSFTVSRSSQCGFIWTRNFLLKQVSWYCGDTSERLLEIESRLVDENDGVLTNIQEKLNYIYEDNNGFINDCLHSLSDISYAINNLDFGALGDISLKLDRIIGYLDFDIDIDINKLVSPWKEIFQIGKGLFDNSSFMWRNMLDSYDFISDGLEVDPNYSDNVLLPSITGPVPLLPSVAPNPLLPILTPVPTLVPISVGGG